MIKRVFDAPNNPPYYVCTECNWAFSGLQEASNHARECGQAVPIQPAFRSYTTAATFEEDVPMPTPEHEGMSRASSLISRVKLTDKQRKERTEKYFPSPAKAALPDDDDDTQVYRKPWVGLTPEEVLDLFDVNNVYGSKWIEFARTVEAALKKKNA